MSADNYLLVRPFGDKWTFTMEFASDDTVLSAPDDRYGVWDTRTDALYAAHQYAAENIQLHAVLDDWLAHSIPPNQRNHEPPVP